MMNIGCYHLYIVDITNLLMCSQQVEFNFCCWIIPLTKSDEDGKYPHSGKITFCWVNCRYFLVDITILLDESTV